MSTIILTKQDFENNDIVPIPELGQMTIGFDLDEDLKVKYDTGSVSSIGDLIIGPTGPMGATGIGMPGISGGNSLNWIYGDESISGGFIYSNSTWGILNQEYTITINEEEKNGSNANNWFSLLENLVSTPYNAILNVSEIANPLNFAYFQIDTVGSTSSTWEMSVKLLQTGVQSGPVNNKEYSISWMGLGINGTSGTSGINGTSGTSGDSGTSGTSGTSGVNGISGTSGTSGTNGLDGIDGSSGTSGVNGVSGTSGTNGTSGTSGTSGIGTPGMPGTSGTSGTSGIAGATGATGAAGTSGTSGSSGTNGATGANGTSGTSGLSGTSGTSGTSGIGASFTTLSYNDLVGLIDTHSLIPGSYYLISDFQTIYDQPDYSSSGNAKNTVVTKYSTIDPIIVLATSESTLDGNAYQPSHPKDRLRYDYTFAHTEIMGATAKGRIIERIDEYNNRTDYDHRTVLFKRYITTDNITDYKDNSSTPFEVLTFQSYDPTSTYNNFIGNYDGTSSGFLLSNNVLLGVSYNNTIGGNSFNNSLYMINNTTGSRFTTNSGTGSFRENTIASNFSFNTLKNNFDNNRIASNFSFNVINNKFNYNDVKCEIFGIFGTLSSALSASYSTTVFDRADKLVRVLSYNSSDVAVITGLTA